RPAMRTRRPLNKEIVVTSPTFAAIRTDERFICVLALSRLINALSVARGPIMTPMRWQTPRAQRERMSALLYAGAVLHEGLLLSRNLGRDFRHLPQYKRGFARIHRSKRYQKLQGWLKTIRNQAAFHFDADLVRASLKDADQSEYRVVLLRSKRLGDVYHSLADDVVFWRLFGTTLSQDEAIRQFTELSSGIGDLFEDFMVSAGSLIPAALLELGCVRRPVAR
ncbi:MAG: hypothetical protein AB1762_21220, partial [Gemmatimonadota bacterium]